MPQPQKGYHTNLATEFYVLSVLHRLEIDASLTLSNRKGIDIIVLGSQGEMISVEVKGSKGTTGWWVNNVETREKGHYIIFVTYKNKMDELEELPECWVIPSKELDKFIRPNPNNKIVGRERLTKYGSDYRNAWSLIKD